MNLFEKHLSQLAHAVTTVSGALVIVLMVVQIVVVVLRYVFSIGVQWGQDLLVYLFMLSSVLPLWLVILNNHNVRVDVLYQGYGAGTKILLDRIGLFFLLLPVCAYTIWVSIGPAVNSWSLLEASPTFGGLPGYFLLKTVQALVFAGLAVVAAILLMRRQPWPDLEKTDG